MQLQEYSISALLGFGIDPKTMRPWFSFAAVSQLLTLHVNGIVHMGISRFWADRFSDDTDVLEVRCETRSLCQEELSGYRFLVDDLAELPKLTVITIEGPLTVKIICDSYENTLEPFRNAV